MREIERKEFLRWSGLGLGALALGMPKKETYILWGDGIHDDTEAFQAWVNGEEVYWEGSGEMVEEILMDKRFKISNAIYIRPLKSEKVVHHCTFLCNDMKFPRGASVFEFV